MEEVSKRLPADMELPQALPYWPPELRETFQETYHQLVLAVKQATPAGKFFSQLSL